MTTFVEVFEAAKQLPLDEQLQLLRRLSDVVESKQPVRDHSSPLGLPPDFTQRLQELFHRAKRKALSTKVP